MATQVIALIILQWTKIIPRELTLQLLFVHLIAITISVLQGLIHMSSLYCCLVINLIYWNIINSWMENIFGRKLALLCDIFLTIGSTYLFKSGVTLSHDYNHVFDILKSKFTNFKNFHTMLYTCSPEFDFIQLETIHTISKTLLLPIAIIAGMSVMYYWYGRWKNTKNSLCIEAGVAYNGLQTCAFIIMATLVMRLKLFMTPHLCIIAGMAVGQRYLVKFGIRNTVLFILLTCAISFHGVQKLNEERQFHG